VIRRALEDVVRAGIPFATRGEQPIDDLPPGGDVDVLVGAGDEAAVERALVASGFHRLRSPGHRRHRFFLAFDRERARWLKIDVSLVPRRLGWDLTARDPENLERFAGYRVGTKARPSRLERAWSWVARRRPLGLRRQGPVVAVLGPDGAGKGSVIAAVRPGIPAGVKPLYLGHGDVSRAEYARRPNRPERPRSPVRRSAGVVAARLVGAEVKMAQYRARRALGLALRSWRAFPYAWRGDIVVCDRHPLEALAVERDDRSLGARVEHRLLRALVPTPDAIVLLDAPGEVLFARKGEHSPEALERARRAYRETFVGERTTTVGAERDLDAVAADVTAVLWRALCERRGW